MPRDTNGNYTLPAGNPVVPGSDIEASWANDTMPDLGAGIQDSLSRSGQGGMLAPLRLADGSEAAPALTFTNDPDMGAYRSEGGSMSFSVGGARVFSLAGTGNTVVVDVDLNVAGQLRTQAGAVDALPIDVGSQGYGFWLGPNGLMAESGGTSLNLTTADARIVAAQATADAVQANLTALDPQVGAAQDAADAAQATADSALGMANNLTSTMDMVTSHLNPVTGMLTGAGVNATGAITTTGGMGVGTTLTAREVTTQQYVETPEIRFLVANANVATLSVGTPGTDQLVGSLVIERTTPPKLWFKTAAPNTWAQIV